MYMTEGEIGRSYRSASDKSKQIRILAQLNACKKDQIANILIKNGYKLRITDDKVKYNRYKKIAKFAWPDKKISSTTIEKKVEKYISDRYNGGDAIHVIAEDIHMDCMAISEIVDDCKSKGLIS